MISIPGYRPRRNSTASRRCRSCSPGEAGFPAQSWCPTTAMPREPCFSTEISNLARMDSSSSGFSLPARIRLGPGSVMESTYSTPNRSFKYSITGNWTRPSMQLIAVQNATGIHLRRMFRSGPSPAPRSIPGPPDASFSGNIHAPSFQGELRPNELPGKQCTCPGAPGLFRHGVPSPLRAGILVKARGRTPRATPAPA